MSKCERENVTGVFCILKKDLQKQDNYSLQLIFLQQTRPFVPILLSYFAATSGQQMGMSVLWGYPAHHIRLPCFNLFFWGLSGKRFWAITCSLWLMLSQHILFETVLWAAIRFLKHRCTQAIVEAPDTESGCRGAMSTALTFTDKAVIQMRWLWGYLEEVFNRWAKCVILQPFF